MKQENYSVIVFVLSEFKLSDNWTLVIRQGNEIKGLFKSVFVIIFITDTYIYTCTHTAAQKD